MGKLLLSFVLCFCFSLLANAQFNKGNVLLGGQLGYGTTKNTAEPTPFQKTGGGNFTIALGKALNENTVFGINFSYLPGSQSNDDPNSGYVNYKTYGYAAGVFYRKYKSLGKEFYLFGESGLNYQGSTFSDKDISGNKTLSGSSNGGNIYIMPGIAYRISKKFFLEISVPNLFSASYNNSKTTTSGITTTQDQFSIGANLSSNTLSSLGIGFRLVL